MRKTVLIKDFIKHKIVFKMMKPFVLIQFSPPRSGSTLIFNIMREIYPFKKIFKMHTFRSMCKEMPVVLTYRHPLDCIASSIIRYNKQPTTEEIERQIKIFNEQGFLDLVNIKNQTNVLMLKYEDFVHDFEYIFNHFENFFGIKISIAKRQLLTEKYNIQSVEKMLKDGNSFAVFDKKTQLHSNHISSYKGASNYYEDFFNADQITMLKTVYADIMQTFQYQ